MKIIITLSILFFSGIVTFSYSQSKPYFFDNRFQKLDGNFWKSEIDTNSFEIIRSENKSIVLIVNTKDRTAKSIAKFISDTIISKPVGISIRITDSTIVIHQFKQDANAQLVYTINKSNAVVSNIESVTDSDSKFLYKATASINEKYKQIPSIFKLCKTTTDDQSIKQDCSQHELFINLDLLLSEKFESPLLWYSRKESNKYIASYINLAYFKDEKKIEKKGFTKDIVEVEYLIDSFLSTEN